MPAITMPTSESDSPARSSATRAAAAPIWANEWEDASAAGALSYNLYRGLVTGLAGGDYGTCKETGIAGNGTAEGEVPPPGVAWFYLVTGANPAAEGPMGETSGSGPRVNSAPCGS